MNLFSLNVCGIRDANKRMSLMQWLSHRRLDIVCLQATHAVSASESSAWFSPMVSLQCRLWGPLKPVAWLFCTARVLFLIVLGWNCVAGSPWLSSWTGTFSFESYVSTLPIATQSLTPFCFPALILLIPLFLLFFAETSMPFGIAARTGGGRLMIPPITTARPVWRYLHPDPIAFSWTRHDGLLASRIHLFGCPLSWAHGVHACDLVPCPYSDHVAVALGVSPLFSFFGALDAGNSIRLFCGT